MRIEALSFGVIKIDGRKIRRDVLIDGEGNLKLRRGGLFIFGSHRIKRAEVEEASKGARYLIVGTGIMGKAKLTPNAQNFLREKGLEAIVLPSREAVRKFNELVDKGERVSAIIHITC